MRHSLPVVSAFAIVRRPDGAVLCTVERKKHRIGVPGGKKSLSDAMEWESIVRREFQEEVGVEMPASASSCYLEWGSSAYQVRFKIIDVSSETAAAIPTGPSSDRGVVEIAWHHPARLNRRRVRPHVYAAL